MAFKLLQFVKKLLLIRKCFRNNLNFLLPQRFKLTTEITRAEKSLRLFPTSHQNAYKHLFMASFFTASQRLAAATYKLVSYYWSKRSIKMIRYLLTSWLATVTRSCISRILKKIIKVVSKHLTHFCYPIRLVLHQHLNSHVAYPGLWHPT